MLIGICDNDARCLDQTKQIIINYTTEHAITIELEYFESGTQLLSYNGPPMEVLFMDIELGKQSGIDIASDVNRKWPSCQIVYLTDYLFYATEVYNTSHSFFVLKKQFSSKVHDVFQKVQHQLAQNEIKMAFTVIGGNEVILSPREIFYFERVKRTTLIVTTWGQYVIWDKISDIIKRLPQPDFLRCHNSYIVYLPAIHEMQKNAFIMNNGTKIFISRSYAKEAKEAFMKWALTQIS